MCMWAADTGDAGEGFAAERREFSEFPANAVDLAHTPTTTDVIRRVLLLTRELMWRSCC